MSAQSKLPVQFIPDHFSNRHDGWTAERQIAFIETLAETACVDQACRRVGMSASSAYRFRRRPLGALFREAWDSALDYGLHRLEQAALSRALHGVPRPIFHKGEQVGEWRDYDERLTMFLLRNRRPARFGKWMDRMLPPTLPSQDDADNDLRGKLDLIEMHSDAFDPDEFDPDEPDLRTRVEG